MNKTTAPLDTAFDTRRHALPRIAVVVALHALLLFAFIAGDRLLRPSTPQTVMLLATVPEIAKPPPPPPPPPLRRMLKQRAPAREAAAPPLRDIDVVQRTDLLATIVDNAPPVAAAGGKPDGEGAAGAGAAGAGGGGKDTVQALIDPANCPTQPEFPKLSGHVILAVLIGVDGTVTDARIARSSGISLLDQTALALARGCHFVAATVDKAPVPSWEAFRFSWTDRRR